MSGFTTVPLHNPGDTFPSADWNTVANDLNNGGVMRMLADTKLLGSVASIDFASIPQTFAHLKVVAYLHGDQASPQAINLKMNGDGAANHYLWGGASLQSGTTTVGNTGSSPGDTKIQIPAFLVGTGNANMAGIMELLIPHYTDTTYWHHVLGHATCWDAGPGHNYEFFGVWEQALAINELTFTPAAGNFVAGTRITVYGLPQ
jgi:hypothetical protein